MVSTRCPRSWHPEQFHGVTLLLVLGEHGRGPAGRRSSTAASRDSPSDLDGDGGSRNGKQSQSDRRGDRQCDDGTAHGAGRGVSEGHPSQEPAGLLTGYVWELSSRAGLGALSCCTFHGQRYRLFRDGGPGAPSACRRRCSEAPDWTRLEKPSRPPVGPCSAPHTSNDVARLRGRPVLSTTH